MKASLSRWLAMKGLRIMIQMRRWSATSLRFCYSACRSLFMRQPKATQNLPDSAAMNVDTVGFGQFSDQLVERDLALGGDVRIDQTGHPRPAFHVRRHCLEAAAKVIPFRAAVWSCHSRISVTPGSAALLRGVLGSHRQTRQLAFAALLDVSCPSLTPISASKQRSTSRPIWES